MNRTDQPSGALEVVRTSRGWSVRGEIDAGTCPDLDAALADLPDVPDVPDGIFELDLAEVTFIDSSGLRVLTTLVQRMHNTSGTVVIRNPSRPVARIVELTGLSSMFGLDPTKPIPPEMTDDHPDRIP